MTDRQLPGHPTHSPAPTSAVDAVFLALQQATVGRYSIQREIGQGGMGIVFLAYDVTLERQVAIKMLRPEIAEHEEARRRFRREASLAAQLSHPNIVPIFTVEEHGDVVFFVMGHVNGDTIRAWVERNGPLTPDQTIRIMREIAWALGYAHARQVVHGDIKPDNVILDAVTGRAMVTDFGIAQRVGDPVSGEIAGTIDFMSPEQISGTPLTGSADLYALGALGYYALTGSVPFSADTDELVLMKQLHAPPPSPETMRRDVPPDLSRIVTRCLAKDPDDRYPSAEALAGKLGEALRKTRRLPSVVAEFLRFAGASSYRTSVLAPVAGVLVYAIAVIDRLNPSDAPLVLLLGWILIAELVVRPTTVVFAARRVLESGLTYGEFRALVAGYMAQADRGPGRRSGIHHGRRRLTVGSLLLLVSAALLVASVGDSAVRPVLLGIRALGVTTLVVSVWLFMSGTLALAGDQYGDFGRYEVWLGRFGNLVFRLAAIRLPYVRTRTVPQHVRPEDALGRDVNIEIDLSEDADLDVAELRDVTAELQARVSRLRRLRDSRLRTDDRVPTAALDESITEAIAALDEIRLDLLRHRAGVGEAGALESDMTRARAMMREPEE